LAIKSKITYLKITQINGHEETRMIQRYLLLIFTIFSIILLLSCAKEIKPRVTSKDELYLFLDTLEQRYEAACSAMELVRWNMATKEAGLDIHSARKELSGIFLDLAIRNIIIEWKNQSGSLADKPLSRRLELWNRAFVGGHIEFDADISAAKRNIANRFSNEKIILNGVEKYPDEVIEQLRAERNQKKRKSLWQSFAESRVKYLDEYRKMVKLLNAKARAEGFPNYYSLSMYLDGIDEGRFLNTFDMLTDLTRPAYEKILLNGKKKLKLKSISPWDIELLNIEQKQLPEKYFKSDSLVTTLNRFLDSMGFQTTKLKKSIQSRYNQKTNNCFRISIPKDIRILIKQGTGNQNYGESFAAYAQGLKAGLTKVDYPILKSYGIVPGTFSPAYEDGLAQLLGDMPTDSLWLRKFSRVKEKELKQFNSKQTVPALINLRQRLKAFRTEYEFYKNPDMNADSLESILLEQYLGVSPDSNTIYSFTLYNKYIIQPATSYRTILSQMVTAQIQEVLEDKFGSRRNTDSLVARWAIDHLYASGERLDWQERIRNATGKSVEPGPFLRKLGIEHSSLLTTDNQK
jgi:hypothetical protein